MDNHHLFWKGKLCFTIYQWCSFHCQVNWSKGIEWVLDCYSLRDYGGWMLPLTIFFSARGGGNGLWLLLLLLAEYRASNSNSHETSSDQNLIRTNKTINTTPAYNNWHHGIGQSSNGIKTVRATLMFCKQLSVAEQQRFPGRSAVLRAVSCRDYEAYDLIWPWHAMVNSWSPHGWSPHGMSWFLLISRGFSSSGISSARPWWLFFGHIFFRAFITASTCL